MTQVLNQPSSANMSIAKVAEGMGSAVNLIGVHRSVQHN